MRAPSPVLSSPREIMMDTPISQISGSAKELSASRMAAAGLSAVTPVTATSVMARMDSAPMGMTLPMMAAITPTNMASRCHAWGLTPAGAGISQMPSASATAMAAGMG